MTSSWISAQACSSSSEAAAPTSFVAVGGPGTAPAPIAERGPQPLAAGQYELAHAASAGSSSGPTADEGLRGSLQEGGEGCRDPDVQVGEIGGVGVGFSMVHPGRHDEDVSGVGFAAPIRGSHESRPVAEMGRIRWRWTGSALSRVVSSPKSRGARSTSGLVPAGSSWATPPLTGCACGGASSRGVRGAAPAGQPRRRVQIVCREGPAARGRSRRG